MTLCYRLHVYNLQAVQSVISLFGLLHLNNLSKTIQTRKKEKKRRMIVAEHLMTSWMASWIHLVSPNPNLCSRKLHTVQVLNVFYAVSVHLSTVRQSQLKLI